MRIAEHIPTSQPTKLKYNSKLKYTSKSFLLKVCLIKENTFKNKRCFYTKNWNLQLKRIGFRRFLQQYVIIRPCLVTMVCVSR